MDWKTKTDLECIESALDGQQAGFEELVNRYKNLIYSMIYRMTKDREEANDLAQEVFIKIYRNLGSYSSEYRFSTWVMRITTNLVIDHRRKRKLETVSIEAAGDGSREEAGLGVLDRTADTDESPEDVLLRREEQTRIRRLIDRLPDMYKAPILLYHQKGLSYQEIADAIDEPISKVKNRIFRGRKMLKEYYLELNGGAT